MDIKNILRQHDEIFGLIKQVRAYQNQEQVKEHAFEISKALAQLAGILKVHLSSEDKFVYPVLVKHQDAVIRTTAEAFAQEMGELFKVFDAYKTKYMGASKITENAAAFIDETKTVFLALETRINKENMSLYPLVK